MIRNFLSIVTAAAIAGVVFSPSANASTTSDMKAELAKKVETKSGFAAEKAAAAVLGKYVKLDFKKVVSFTKLALSSIKKTKTAVDAAGATKLSDKMANGYFSKVKYNPGDSKFVSALNKIIGALKNPTVAELNAVLAPLYALNSNEGGTLANKQLLTNTVFTAGGLTPPIVS